MAQWPLPPYASAHITTWHHIPTSNNPNRSLANIALLHNTTLRGALAVDHVLTMYISIGSAILQI